MNELAFEGLVLLGFGGRVALPTTSCDSPRSQVICPPPVLQERLVLRGKGVCNRPLKRHVVHVGHPLDAR